MFWTVIRIDHFMDKSMSIPQERLVAVQSGDGTIKVAQQDMPELKKGTVLVKVGASLVSPGTELGGWHSFAEQKRNPMPKKEQPFGYSNAGAIIEVAEGVSEFKPGDRIACIGAGYALHTDYAVVPHNLCVPLPDNVTFEQGAYGMLFATAMQTLRRGQPEFGEYICVVGLGIVGLLTTRLYQLAGNYVFGWDKLPARVTLAKQWGIDAVVEDENGPEATIKFTNGNGLDAAVLAMAGPCDETVDRLMRCMKHAPDGHGMGRIMIVGWPEFQYGSNSQIGRMNNIDIRRCSRTGAGYHDDEWEYGPDYPPVFMRWTTKTNLKLCMRLISEGKVNVDALTTHRIQLVNVEREIDAALADPDCILGVIFKP
jgi:threonine dehydrogenase-like Zn-dependent dehydrogenase